MLVYMTDIISELDGNMAIFMHVCNHMSLSQTRRHVRKGRRERESRKSMEIRFILKLVKYKLFPETLNFKGFISSIGIFLKYS